MAKATSKNTAVPISYVHELIYVKFASVVYCWLLDWLADYCLLLCCTAWFALNSEESLDVDWNRPDFCVQDGTQTNTHACAHRGVLRGCHKGTTLNCG